MINKHMDAAERRLYNGTVNEVARAGVEATLALAHEQRTANLIALWSNPQAEIDDARGNHVVYGINETTIGDILQAITERLGLA
jgi:hypothetical protein